MKVTIDVPDDLVPEGWEATGFRDPNPGEHYRSIIDGSVTCRENTCWTYGPRLILRRKPPTHREPTADDVGEMVEVADDKRLLDSGNGVSRRFFGEWINDNGERRFLCVSEDGREIITWRNARIAITELKPTKSWQWPEWIKPGTWIAMDENHDWFLYMKKPKSVDGKWRPEGRCIRVSGTAFFNFTPPPCNDWTQSLMQKPEVTQ